MTYKKAVEILNNKMDYYARAEITTVNDAKRMLEELASKFEIKQAIESDFELNICPTCYIKVRNAGKLETLHCQHCGQLMELNQSEKPVVGMTKDGKLKGL